MPSWVEYTSSDVWLRQISFELWWSVISATQIADQPPNLMFATLADEEGCPQRTGSLVTVEATLGIVPAPSRKGPLSIGLCPCLSSVSIG